MHKKQHGQFFTKQSPFDSEAFIEWSQQLPENFGSVIEPFAGDCDIAKHLPQFEFDFYDIDPKMDNIEQRDSLKNFPKGYQVCITNPPYLGKSSAKRAGIPYNSTHTDLYLHSLHRILSCVKYAATIIPAAFLANDKFKTYLSHVDVITSKLFDDTDVPVIVAYFDKSKRHRYYKLYEDGVYKDTIKVDKPVQRLKQKNTADVKFNCDDGNLGLYAIDGTTGQRIRFCHGSEIQRQMKISDRAITKIKVDIEITDDIIKILNDMLEEYRTKTFDTTLTSFRGLQQNGQHRKRISFKIVKQLIGALNV